jgi:hypothetical protein
MDSIPVSGVRARVGKLNEAHDFVPPQDRSAVSMAIDSLPVYQQFFDVLIDGANSRTAQNRPGFRAENSLRDGVAVERPADHPFRHCYRPEVAAATLPTTIPASRQCRRILCIFEFFLPRPTQ